MLQIGKGKKKQEAYWEKEGENPVRGGDSPIYKDVAKAGEEQKRKSWVGACRGRHPLRRNQKRGLVTSSNGKRSKGRREKKEGSPKRGHS